MENNMNEILALHKIKAIPAKVDGLDFELAKLEIKKNIKNYKNMVVTEENTPDIKKIIAELRKESRELNQVKIDIKKELTSSVTEMEKEFKELISIYDMAISPLDNKVKEFEKLDLEKRKKEALELAEGVASMRGYSMDYIIPSDKWYLKTAKQTLITEDVARQIEDLNGKEKAIEQALKANNELLGSDLMEYNSYKRLLKEPVHVILERIEQDFKVHHSTLEKAKEKRDQEEREQEVREQEVTVEEDPFFDDPEPEESIDIDLSEWLPLEIAEETHVFIKVRKIDEGRVANLLEQNLIEYEVVN